MKYFVIVQDNVNDPEPIMKGPFSSIGEAKDEAENWELATGALATILSQNEKGLFYDGGSWSCSICTAGLGEGLSPAP